MILICLYDDERAKACKNLYYCDNQLRSENECRRATLVFSTMPTLGEDNKA